MPTMPSRYVIEVEVDDEYANENLADYGTTEDYLSSLLLSNSEWDGVSLYVVSIEKQEPLDG